MENVAYQEPITRDRCAGRTTRSILHALDLAREGRQVAFISATAWLSRGFLSGVREGGDLFEPYKKEATFTDRSVRYPNGGEVRFISVREDETFLGRTHVRIPDHYCYDLSVSELRESRTESTRLRTAVSQRDQQIVGLRSDLYDKDREVSALRANLRQKEEELLRLRDVVSEMADLLRRAQE